MSNPSFLPPPPTLPPAIAAAAAAKQEELSRLALRLPEMQSPHQPPHPSLNFPPKASPPKSDPPAAATVERRVAPHLNHEDDDHVDVEQCSDGEDQGGQGDKSGRSGQADKTDNEEGGTGGGNKKKKRKEEKVRVMKPKCNCPELMGVDCFLETKELWDKFNELGTEMIITKTGR